MFKGASFIVLLHETLVTKSGYTYENLQFQKFFLGSLVLAIYARTREGRGGEGKGEEEREDRQAGELAPQT
jgi:hypothetical protein